MADGTPVVSRDHRAGSWMTWVLWSQRKEERRREGEEGGGEDGEDMEGVSGTGKGGEKEKGGKKREGSCPDCPASWPPILCSGQDTPPPTKLGR